MKLTTHTQVSIEHDYVAISNMTEKDQIMKGWTISKVSAEETLEYKFPAKAVIGPDQTLKVTISPTAIPGIVHETVFGSLVIAVCSVLLCSDSSMLHNFARCITLHG